MLNRFSRLIPTAVRPNLVADVSTASALPDNCPADRLPRASLKDAYGFALIRNANSRELAQRKVRFFTARECNCPFNSTQHRSPNLFEIVFNPACLRIMLRKLNRSLGNDSYLLLRLGTATRPPLITIIYRYD